MSTQQPPRQTKLIITEVANKEHPEKPAVIEHPGSEVQMTAKDGAGDQRNELAEDTTGNIAD